MMAASPVVTVVVPPRATRRGRDNCLEEAFTLDALAADPARAVDLPIHIVAGLLAGIAAVQAALAARILVLAAESAQTDSSRTEDTLLTANQAASRLAVSPDWVYRRASRLPFTVRLDRGALRFSTLGIERYLRQRPGSK